MWSVSPLVPVILTVAASERLGHVVALFLPIFANTSSFVLVQLTLNAAVAPGGGHNGTEGWGQYLQYSLDSSRMRVNNSAYAGRSARTFTREGRFQAIFGKVQPGDWVVIEFGHNDGRKLDLGLRHFVKRILILLHQLLILRMTRRIEWIVWGWVPRLVLLPTSRPGFLDTCRACTEFLASDTPTVTRPRLFRLTRHTYITPALPSSPWEPR